MTGPLAQQFAQVREESALLADWAEEPLGMGSVDVDNVRGRLLEALSFIERHVQDMEKALEDLANMALLVFAGGDTAHLEDALQKADDALVAAGRWLPTSAREKEEECPGGHGEQCCGYPAECREALKEAR